MMHKKQVSGVVLAGGMSRRLGRNKAVEPIEGEPLIRRVIGRLSKVTDETVVVVNDRRRANELPLPESSRVVMDAFPDGGSLGGIYTGLKASMNGWAAVVACDMPFINAALFTRMLDIRDGFDVVVPVLDGRPEPTHALYSKVCLPNMQRRLQADDLKIARFFGEVRVNYVHQDEVERLDHDLLSFFNVNTQDDLDRALILAAEGR